MRTKVVYNACYGGFGVSWEAVEAMRAHGHEGAKAEQRSNSGSHLRDIDRHDPILVRVVEELGAKASAPYAELALAEVEGPYRIDEYDGNESVETPDSYEWVTP